MKEKKKKKIGRAQRIITNSRKFVLSIYIYKPLIVSSIHSEHNILRQFQKTTRPKPTMQIVQLLGRKDHNGESFSKTGSFLQEYGLQNDFKLNIEPNHTTLAGHAPEHDIAMASAYGMLGSVDSNSGDMLLGSGIELTDQGEHDLKGIAGRWRLYEVS